MKEIEQIKAAEYARGREVERKAIVAYTAKVDRLVAAAREAGNHLVCDIRGCYHHRPCDPCRTLASLNAALADLEANRT